MAAISPFNFTAIGGNLAGAPALMVRTRDKGQLVTPRIPNKQTQTVCPLSWETYRGEQLELWILLGSSSWFILQPCPFVGDWGRTQAQGHSFLLC